MASTAVPPQAVPERTATRKPLFRHPWRVAIVVAALFLVGNLVAIYILDGADTRREGRTFPVAIDTVTPRPGEIIRPQDDIVADLDPTLTGVLLIRGQEVPEDQTDRVVNLGELAFRPGPGKDIEAFEPGTYTATVLYWPQGKARPANPAGYSWSFRVSA
jgi:hypothetical protein